MNFKKITISTILCALLFVSLSAFAQKKEVKYEVGTSAVISSKSTLPFWLVSNKNGIIPNENSGLIFLRLKSDYTPSNSKFIFLSRASIVGSQRKGSEVD